MGVDERPLHNAKGKQLFSKRNTIVQAPSAFPPKNAGKRVATVPSWSQACQIYINFYFKSCVWSFAPRHHTLTQQISSIFSVLFGLPKKERQIDVHTNTPLCSVLLYVPPASNSVLNNIQQRWFEWVCLLNRSHCVKFLLLTNWTACAQINLTTWNLISRFWVV